MNQNENDQIQEVINQIKRVINFYVTGDPDKDYDFKKRKKNMTAN